MDAAAARRRRLTLAVLLVAALPPAPALSAQDAPVTAHVLDSACPGLVFVENRGQWDASIPFVSRFGRACIRPERGALALAVFDETGTRGHILRIPLHTDAQPAGAAPVGDVFHFLEGSSAEAWTTHASGFAEVVYEEAWPGTRLRVAGSAEGLLATASVTNGDFGLEVQGADDVRCEIDGSMRVTTTIGDVLFAPPTVRGLATGGVATPGRWALRQGRAVPETGPDEDLGLAYDVTWSTFFGGASGAEHVRDVIVTQEGTVTFCGWTTSSDFPTTPGALADEYNSPGFFTAFVSRVSADGGTILYSTYLGGSSGDWANGLASAGDGEVVVVGNTASPEFPVTRGALDTNLDFDSDGFITRLTSDGSDVAFSTFLGSDGVFVPGESISGFDEIRCLAIDSDGSIVVAGETQSPSFPVTPGAFQPASASPPGSFDLFVTRVNPTGSAILASTYLGGGPIGFSGGHDQMRDIAIQADGTIVVAGYTESPSFPVTDGVIGPTHATPGFDGFITAFQPGLDALVFSTFLGGPKSDLLNQLALTPDGSIVVVGETVAPDFPTTPDAWSTTGGGNADVFISRIDATGTTLEYSTLFGGAVDEQIPVAVVVDSAGSVIVAGLTYSFTFPITPGAFQEVKGDPPLLGRRDMFVSRFHPDGQSLLYSTYLGGDMNELGFGPSGLCLALTPEGDVVLGGYTASSDFPTTPGTIKPDPDTLPNNAVLVKLVTLPTGASRYGQAVASPAGLPSIGVLSMPQVGDDGFGTTCASAPPWSRGWLLFALAPLTEPTHAAGASLWVDPARLLALAPVTSNGFGWTQTRLPLADDPALAGEAVFVQYVWPGPPGTAPASSAALHLVVQP